MTTYTILVKFERELDADEECIEAALEENPLAYGHAKTRDERLVIQLAKEIQTAFDCDDCSIAGMFQVVSVPKHRDTITDEELKGPFKQKK